MLSNAEVKHPMVDLIKGERIKISGAELEVDEVTKDNVLLREIVSQTPHVFKHKDFVSEYESGKFVFVLTEDKQKGLEAVNDNIRLSFAVLPERDQKEAEYREKYVELIDRELPGAKPDKYIKSLVKQNYEKFIAEYVNLYNFGCDAAPSAKSVRRWHAKWKAADRRIIALAPQNVNKGNKKPRLKNELEQMILECIDEHYLRREKVAMDTVKAMLFNMIEGWNADHHTSSEQIQMPNKSALYRGIKKFDPYEVAVKKHGKVEADRMYKPIFAMPELKRPMQVVQLDHTPMDIMIKLPGMAKPMRPYLTTIIDQYSRVIVGFHIGFESYGYTPVMLAIQNMILSKAWVNKKYPGIINECPAFGPPEIILLDNAPEHHGRSMKRMCQELGIIPKFSESRTPQQKAQVERLYGTINTKVLHQIKGTTFSNTHEKGDYEAEANAFLKFDQLLEVMHEFIYDEYHMEYHRGLRNTPLAKMQEALQVWKMRPLRMDMEEFRFVTAALSRKNPKVQPYGVEWEHLSFNSHELSRLRARAQGNLEVEVKYNPLDLSYIWVFDQKTKTRMKVPSVKPQYTKDLTKFQHDVFIRSTKPDANKKYKPEDLMRSRSRIWGKLEKWRKENNANSPRAAIFQGYRQTPSPDEIEKHQEQIAASKSGFDDANECALDGINPELSYEHAETGNEVEASEEYFIIDDDDDDDIREIAALSAMRSS